MSLSASPAASSRVRAAWGMTAVVAVLFAIFVLPAGIGKAAIPSFPNQSSWVLPGLIEPSTDKKSVEPVLATGDDGTTAMVWVQSLYSNSNAIRVRLKEPGEPFGPARQISISKPNATVLKPKVDVGADGSVVVAWCYWDLWADAGPSPVVHAAFRPAGGTFGATVRVSAGDADWRNLDHQVAAGSGKAFAVWVRKEGGVDVIKRAMIDANGVRQLSSLKAHSGILDEGHRISDAGHPQLDVGGNGVGAIVWQEFIDQEYFLPYGPAQTVRLTRFNASNGNLLDNQRLTEFFRTPSRISGEDEWTRAAKAAHPDVAVDGAGRTLAVWRQDTRVERSVNSNGTTRHKEYQEPRIKAVEFDQSGVKLAPAQNISVATGQERDIAVETAPNGSTAVIWNTGDGHWDIAPEPDARADIFVAVRKAGHTEFEVHQLKSNRGRVGSTGVGISPQGEATAIWTRGADQNTVVESRKVRGDGTVEPTRRLSDLIGRPYFEIGFGPYTNPLESSVSVGPDGHAYAAWTTMVGHRRVQWTMTDTSPNLALNLEIGGDGSGRVTSQPLGIDCGSDCSTELRFNEQIQLTATPSAGSVFVGWEGACVGVTESVCRVDMAGPTTVRAIFHQVFDLDVEVTRAGHGRVVSSPVGIDCGPDCHELVENGKVVSLYALPSPGSVFVGWGGECSGAQPVCQVMMDQARTVTARFSRFFNLQVSRSGLGSVTSSPVGIDCSPTFGPCLKAFEVGTEVTLTASPAEGSAFTGWAGDCSGSQLTCVVEIDDGKVVGARFTSGYELSVNVMSPGAGSVATTEGPLNCSPSVCRGEFAPGTQVELLGIGKPGFAFANWSDVCESSGETCLVTMDAARDMTAYFDPGEKVNVSFLGEGSGRVLSDPGGLDCGSGDVACEGWFQQGSGVTLSAVPEPGSVFVGWEKADPSHYSGGCEGGEESCVATVGLPVRVAARFEPEAEPEPAPVLSGGEEGGDGGGECVAPELQVSQLKRTPGSTVILKVWAPRAGVAIVRGPQVIRTRVKLKRAGWTRIKVRPNPTLARKLKNRRAVKTGVTVRYLAEGDCGSTSTRARVLFGG